MENHVTKRASEAATGMPKMMNDTECVRRYLKDHDQEAFRCLVERYSGMVYGVALRQTSQASLAEEAAQTVFIQLAKKAAALRNPASLASWLYRSAVLESLHLLRRRSRERKHRERLMEATRSPDEHADSWREVIPCLDIALNQLSQSDRQIILARFYHEHSYSEIAAHLQKSEAACRKQISRALKKLSRLLKRQGVLASTALLAQGLQPELAAASPVGLVDVIEGRVADLSGHSALSTVSASLMAAISSKTMLVIVAGLSAVAPVVASKRETLHDQTSAPAASYSVLPSTRLAPLVNDTVSVEDILAALGTEQLALLLRWLPSASNADLERLATTRLSMLQVEGVALNSVSFWSLLFQRWVTLDSHAALTFAEDSKKTLRGHRGQELFDLEMIFLAWAKAAPDKALAAAEQRSAPLVVIVLNELQNRDPWKVIELSKQLDPGIASLINWGDLFETLAKRDLTTATEAAQAMPPSRNQDRALFAVAMATMASDPQAGLAMLEGRSRVPLLQKWLAADWEGGFQAIQAEPKSIGKLTLMRETAGDYWKRHSEKAKAWAFAIKDPQLRRAALSGLAVAAAESDPLQAKAIFDALGWDVRDPDATTSYVSGGSGQVRGSVETLENAAQQVITAVSKSDRHEALSLLGNVKGIGNEQRLLDVIATPWMSEDRQGFEKAIRAQPSGKLRTSLARWYASALVSDNPNEALQWVTENAALSEEIVIQQVFGDWQQSDPQAAREAYLDHEFPNSAWKDACFESALRTSLSDPADLAKLQDWLGSQADQYDLPRIHERLGNALAEHDLESAAAWVDRLEPSQARQSAIQGVVEQLFNGEHANPQETLAWIEQLPDSSTQQFWLNHLAKQWITTDAETAFATLPNTALSERNFNRLAGRH